MASSPAPALAAGLPVEMLAEVEILKGSLPTMDYFQILKLEKTASPSEIKQAYYGESRAFHPDKFTQLADPELRDLLQAIYMRVTEAYVTLRDDRKRAKYVEDINGPERDKKLRFSEESEAEAKIAAKKAVEEEIGKTPQGRKFYQQGINDFEARSYSAAERNLKMALTYEPSNEKYKEKLKEAQAFIKSDFAIK